MGFCGPNTRRLSAFVTAAILIIIGLLAVLLWGALFNVILKKVHTHVHFNKARCTLRCITIF